MIKYKCVPYIILERVKVPPILLCTIDAEKLCLTSFTYKVLTRLRMHA